MSIMILKVFFAYSNTSISLIHSNYYTLDIIPMYGISNLCCNMVSENV